MCNCLSIWLELLDYLRMEIKVLDCIIPQIFTQSNSSPNPPKIHLIFKKKIIQSNKWNPSDIVKSISNLFIQNKLEASGIHFSKQWNFNKIYQSKIHSAWQYIKFIKSFGWIFIFLLIQLENLRKIENTKSNEIRVIKFEIN